MAQPRRAGAGAAASGQRLRSAAQPRVGPAGTARSVAMGTLAIATAPPACMQVREASATDLQAVLRLQAACHPGELHESSACLAGILAHGHSLLALDHLSGDAVGYALGHPGEQAAFDSAPAAASEQAGAAWFEHDVVVSVEARGAGVARALVDAALARAAARGATHAHLVALPGTAALWARFGFAACDAGAYADAASYGPGAVHMRAALRGTHPPP